MSPSENPFVAETSHSEKTEAGSSLRWWPAAGLLALMGMLKVIPSLMESPPLPVLMMGFMGPAIVCLLILAWWMFASRAGLKEKLIGLIGMICLAVGSALLLHPSLQGMGVMLYPVPCGFALFALTVSLLSSRPGFRLRTALVVSAIGFGAWNSLQMKGVTGKFAPEFAWRWSPTAEQEYLKTLADRGGTAPVGAAEGSGEVVSRASSEWSDFRGPHRDGKLPGIILDED